MKIERALAMGAFTCAFAGVLAAQQGSVTKNVPDLEGGWVRLDLEGGGSYGGVGAKIAPAVLTPQGKIRVAPPADATAAQNALGHGLTAQEAGDTLNRKHEVGEAYIVGTGQCGGGGGGMGIDINSSAVFFLQAKNEVLATREGAGARHIYLDGRAQPDSTTWAPSASGHSVGHYENGDLVVDTTGLMAGTTGFGHGYKTPQTHLTERFHVSPDGQRLTITYTWNDPEIYEKPLVYDMSFGRLPKGSYAMESWCDPSDPLERQSIVPPKQLP